MEQFFTNRQRTIISLLKNSGSFVSGEELSLRLNVTSRTIRNDVERIRRFIREKKLNSFFDIEAVPSKGYRFVVLDEDRFRFFLDNQFENSSLSSFRKNLVREIIVLCSVSRSITIDKICRSVGQSESTIYKLLSEYNKTISKNNITAVYRNRKMVLKGDERQIRRMAANVLFTDLNYSYFSSKVKELKEKEELRSEFEAKTAEILGNQELISVSIEALHFISVIWIISVIRNQNGKELRMNESQKNEIRAYQAEKEIANQLGNWSARHCGFQLSEDDILFLALHIASFAYIRDKALLTENERRTELARKMTEVIVDLSQYNDMYFWDEYKNNIQEFLYAHELRNDFDCFRNYMGFNRIKRNRIESLQLARFLAKVMFQKTGKMPKSRELVLLSTMLGNVFSRAGVSFEKTKVIIASKYGLSEANRIRNALMYHLKQNISEAKCIEVHELQTTTLSDQVVLVDDVVAFNSLQYDLKFYFDPYSTYSELPPSFLAAVSKENIGAIRFIDQTAGIYPGMEWKSKEEVINAICRKTFNEKGTRKRVCREMMDENDICSFSMGNLSAVIPVRHDSIAEPRYELYTLNKAIQWDNDQVQLMIVIYTDEKISNVVYCGGEVKKIIRSLENVYYLINSPKTETLAKIIKE